MSLREVLRDQWPVAVMLGVLVVASPFVAAVLPDDGRSPSGQAVVPAGSSQQAVSPVPASILNAGDRK